MSYTGNHMIDNDNGSSPASPYYKEQKHEPCGTCDSCEHYLPVSMLRKSKFTGETYCTGYKGNCWDMVAAEYYNESEVEVGHEVKQFE